MLKNTNPFFFNLTILKIFFLIHLLSWLYFRTHCTNNCIISNVSISSSHNPLSSHPLTSHPHPRFSSSLSWELSLLQLFDFTGTTIHWSYHFFSFHYSPHVFISLITSIFSMLHHYNCILTCTSTLSSDVPGEITILGELNNGTLHQYCGYIRAAECDWRKKQNKNRIS